MAEYVWTVVPWLIVALCAAPAVHRVLAAEVDMCMSCYLAEGMAQPPTYPPLAESKCIEIQSTLDPIRSVFNCR